MPTITQSLKKPTTTAENKLCTRVLAAALYDEDEFQRLLQLKSVKRLLDKGVLLYDRNTHYD